MSQQRRRQRELSPPMVSSGEQLNAGNFESVVRVIRRIALEHGRRHSNVTAVRYALVDLIL